MSAGKPGSVGGASSTATPCPAIFAGSSTWRQTPPRSAAMKAIVVPELLQTEDYARALIRSGMFRAHLALGASFRLGTAIPAIGHMDTLGVGSTYIERESLAILVEHFDRLRAKALGPEESREFILNRIAQRK